MIQPVMVSGLIVATAIYAAEALLLLWAGLWVVALPLLGATVQAIYLAPSGETERRAARDGAPNRLLRGWRWMNNDLVNLLSSVVGGLIAIGVLLLLGG